MVCFQVQLCALRAQAEYGDHGHANNFDYKSVTVPLLLFRVVRGTIYVRGNGLQLIAERCLFGVVRFHAQVGLGVPASDLRAV